MGEREYNIHEICQVHIHFALQAFHDVRIQTHNTLTHLSLALIIDNATAKHSGTYQCRATDGSDSAHCSDSSLDCVPATTISPPARIQIVGEKHNPLIDFIIIYCCHTYHHRSGNIRGLVNSAH